MAAMRKTLWRGLSASQEDSGRKRSCFRLVWLIAILFFPLVLTLQAEPKIRKERLTIGLTKTAFLNVNRSDMEAALKVLAQTVGEKHGYQVDVQTIFCETAADFKSAMELGKVRLAIMDSWTYVAMRPALVESPSFVSLERGEVGKRYMLLTLKDSTLHKIADLQGKTLTICESANRSLGRPWLETILLSEHLQPIQAHFRSIRSESKPTTALLPVFVGKADACLIDESSFKVMTELNPQVGLKLHAIVTSDSLVDGLQLFAENAWKGAEEVKRDLMQAITDLHLEPSGQQLLNLFKTDRMVPFEDQHLATVMKLRALYEGGSEQKP